MVVYHRVAPTTLGPAALWQLSASSSKSACTGAHRSFSRCRSTTSRYSGFPDASSVCLRTSMTGKFHADMAGRIMPAVYSLLMSLFCASACSREHGRFRM